MFTPEISTDAIASNVARLPGSLSRKAPDRAAFWRSAAIYLRERYKRARVIIVLEASRERLNRIAPDMDLYIRPKDARDTFIPPCCKSYLELTHVANFKIGARLALSVLVHDPDNEVFAKDGTFRDLRRTLAFLHSGLEVVSRVYGAGILMDAIKRAWLHLGDD